MATTTVELVSYEGPLAITEQVAIAGFLAGDTGNTRISYMTDLRIFTEWCQENHLAYRALSDRPNSMRLA